MKLSIFFTFLLLSISIITNAAPALRRKRKRYRPSDFKNLPPTDPKRLLGPNGEGSYTDIDLGYPPASLTNPPNEASGNPAPRYRHSNRQLSANFGHNPVPPGRVSQESMIPIMGSTLPPDPNLGEPVIESIQQISDLERERIALEFFSRANYTSNQITDKKTLIRLMQRNYGLSQTGDLDDVTISMMMSPRCGFPDPPANFQTFPYKEHWTHNPVTYKFAGYTPDMSPCQVRNALKRALRVWEEVTALDFVERDSDDADIIIYFGYQNHGDDYPFDQRNGLLAHAFTAGQSPIAGDTHFDESEFWTLGEGRVIETYYGNADGAPCVFPFIYKDQEYTTCTKAGRSDGLEWCATTRNFDVDGTYGFCSQETLFTYGGNSEGNPCQFPFTFEGKSYDACTYDGRSDGYRWCATTSNFGSDALWGFCPDRAHGTYGGNSDGAACIFPFTFNGQSYSDCTVVGRSDYLPWCATTSDYDRDQKFGLCQDDGYSLFLVAAHEFGHAIGLDHSNQRSALMYPTYQKFENFQLPQDDVNGAQYLYPEARTTPLRPLVLEKCGGNLGGTSTTPTMPTTRATTPRNTTPRKTTPRRTTVRVTTPRTTARQTATPAARTGICDPGPIDALLYFGKEIMLFKGRQFWRIQGSPQGQKRGPYNIDEQWPGLPHAIDSVYKKPSDDSLVFFKGTRYWIYDGFQLRAGYPKKVTTLGLPRDGSFVVDASLNWLRAKNRQKTYFFVGNKFYRFNEIKSKIDGKYPKSMSLWRRIPVDIEAAMENPESKKESLFVKDNIVYILNNYRVEVTETIPLDVWLGCREREAVPAPIVLKKRKKRKRKLP